VRGLEEIAGEIEAGTFRFDPALEDVHMNIETSLRERLGETGGRLHTARSRNDQIAADTRLFVKEEAARTVKLLKNLRRVLLDRAKESADILMPGYTHLQRAQPVRLSHYLLAYWEMFYRDGRRFRAVGESADVCPLGSGALAGVPYPLDREYTADLLGFSAITRNSMDAVSDRDYILEYLFSASVVMVHLSRLAEELVLFSGPEFGFVTLPDGYATGSSIMPQKKNPDVPELVRGKTGRVFGNLHSLLVTLKGLPLAYMRDLQEDKEPLFDTVDTITASLSVMTGLMTHVVYNKGAMERAASSVFITATDAADYLVKKEMNFRDAHETIGRLVAACETEGKDLRDLAPDRWREASDLFGPDIVDVIDPRASVDSRDLPGGTAGRQVQMMLDEAERLEREGK
jgi:argininosuccinate lyase